MARLNFSCLISLSDNAIIMGSGQFTNMRNTVI